MESNEVLRELRKIANLLARGAVEGMNKGDQARVLSAVGFSYAEIAAITGLSEGSIRGHVSRGKRRSATEDD